MTDVVEIIKAVRNDEKLRRRSERRQRTNPFEDALNEWLTRYATKAAKDARVIVDSGRLPISKQITIDQLEEQLRAIMLRFGLQQYDVSGRSSAKAVGGKWIVRPEAKLQYAMEIENKVRLIMDDTESAVRGSLQKIIQDALSEFPRPTAGEVARRIARQWHGPVDGRQALFSPARAAAIARTEIGDADAAGAVEGYAVSGVEKVGWLARSNDGKSEGREHYKMNRHKALTIEDITSSDRSRWFELPSGERCRRPLDPVLPVGERANCRCILVPR